MKASLFCDVISIYVLEITYVRECIRVKIFRDLAFSPVDGKKNTTVSCTLQSLAKRVKLNIIQSSCYNWMK